MFCGGKISGLKSSKEGVRTNGVKNRKFPLPMDTRRAEEASKKTTCIFVRSNTVVYCKACAHRRPFYYKHVRASLTLPKCGVVYVKCALRGVRGMCGIRGMGQYV